MFFGFWYCTPKYWRKRSVSVSNQVFCSSMSAKCVLPSASRIVAAKSMRNTERASRWLLGYSCGRTSKLTMSVWSSAERMVRAIRSSAIRYLNTTS